MHTGDLATIDEEGYVNIVGRIKDMVIRGGENVYPREIEEFLFRHPKVEAVAGRGRARSEIRRGTVRVDQAQNRALPRRRRRFQEFCKDQIAHYKIPRYIKFVDAFPMTVTGKVHRNSSCVNK